MKQVSLAYLTSPQKSPNRGNPVPVLKDRFSSAKFLVDILMLRLRGRYDTHTKAFP